MKIKGVEKQVVETAPIQLRGDGDEHNAFGDQPDFTWEFYSYVLKTTVQGGEATETQGLSFRYAVNSFYVGTGSH